MVELFGGVLGAPTNCSLLMEHNCDVLVFPGGGREVFKLTADPKYDLIWKERLGFARLAIQHGYSIVPFASVGMEEIFIPWIDIPVGMVMKLFGDSRTDFMVSIPKPWKIIPQRLYFKFGNKIDTKRFQGITSEENCRQLRNEVKSEVLEGLQFLRQEQERDARRFSSAWILLASFFLGLVVFYSVILTVYPWIK